MWLVTNVVCGLKEVKIHKTFGSNTGICSAATTFISYAGCGIDMYAYTISWNSWL